MGWRSIILLYVINDENYLIKEEFRSKISENKLPDV